MRRDPGSPLHALRKTWTHSDMKSVSLRDLCKFCKQININTIVPYFPPDLGDDGVQVCLHHQPIYNALQKSVETCPLCRLFYVALDRKNASRHPPEAFKAHENSHIWLVSGDQAFFDLRQPKGLYYLRVNVGSGTLLKDADFNITTRPGTFPIESAPCCLVVHEML